MNALDAWMVITDDPTTWPPNANASRLGGSVKSFARPPEAWMTITDAPATWPPSDDTIGGPASSLYGDPQ